MSGLTKGYRRSAGERACWNAIKGEVVEVGKVGRVNGVMPCYLAPRGVLSAAKPSYLHMLRIQHAKPLEGCETNMIVSDPIIFASTRVEGASECTSIGRMRLI